ncbi:hypothetical protein [Enterovirga aerilata]|uniref:Uncharacterized protein n=1 Tax=Enterovirga aerilata TaxID=2730920 RepID=A0A849I9X1_9HYPH|nr:hypothetical protein [Enterovirga sp. DB1703]NNM74644.1 hypothetical protein [Enterovirga sp. DB1703]
MSRRSHALALALALALGAGLAGLLATAALAQAPAPNTTAEARLAWAKRHVELVCQPLEAQKMFDKATRCYNDVARLMGLASRETTVTAERAAPGPAPSAESAPAATNHATPKARPAIRPAPVRTALARPAPVRIAAAPARPRPAVAAQTDAPAASRSSRCSGMSCMRYTLLGVGF